jgi:hypothetical protein
LSWCVLTLGVILHYYYYTYTIIHMLIYITILYYYTIIYYTYLILYSSLLPLLPLFLPSSSQYSSSILPLQYSDPNILYPLFCSSLLPYLPNHSLHSFYTCRYLRILIYIHLLSSPISSSNPSQTRYPSLKGIHIYL